MKACSVIVRLVLLIVILLLVTGKLNGVVEFRDVNKAGLSAQDVYVFGHFLFQIPEDVVVGGFCTVSFLLFVVLIGFIAMFIGP